MGSKYGKTALESRGIAAIDALSAVFGVANKYTGPLLANDWSGREAMRLVDSLEAHSLAWEPAEEVVGSKLALECAQYFTCYLHPAWAAQNEWAQGIKKLYEENQIPQGKETYSGNLPPAAPQTVASATKDACEWGQKVHQMAVRRSKLARRTRRGLAFAVIDGQTVFARRPDAFASRITKDTDAILRSDVNMQGLQPIASFSQHLPTPVSLANPSVGPSVCVVCHKGDRADQMLLCDGCDSEFHMNCLSPPLSTVPDTDWFCDDCLEDREYMYDHASWGKAGETLVRAVRLTDSEEQKTQAWKKRVLEWVDNDVVLQRATNAAVSMGFTITAAAPTPKASRTESHGASESVSSKSTTNKTPKRERASRTTASKAASGKKTSGARATMMEESRKAEKSMLEAMAAQSNRKILAKRQSLPGPSGTAIPTSSSMSSSIPSPAPPSGLLPERGDTYETPRKPPGPQKPPQDIFKAPPPPIIPPNATPGEALAAYVAHERSLAGERVRNSAVPPSLFPRELLAESAWETRHFAEATVSNLEASNHGLAEALSLVIAQRDALLDLLAPKNCSEVDPVASTSSSSSSQEEKNMEVDDSTTIEQNPVQ